MGGVGAGGQVAQGEREVVPVGTGQGEAPLDLAGAVGDQPLAERLGELGRVGVEPATVPATEDT